MQQLASKLKLFKNLTLYISTYKKNVLSIIDGELENVAKLMLHIWGFLQLSLHEQRYNRY